MMLVKRYPTRRIPNPLRSAATCTAYRLYSVYKVEGPQYTSPRCIQGASCRYYTERARSFTKGAPPPPTPQEAEQMYRPTDEKYILANRQWDVVSHECRLKHLQTGVEIVLVPVQRDSPASISRIRRAIRENSPIITCVDLSKSVNSDCARDAGQLISMVKHEIRAIAADKLASLLLNYERTAGSLPLNMQLLIGGNGEKVKVHLDNRLIVRTNLPTISSDKENSAFKHVRTVKYSSPSFYSKTANSTVMLESVIIDKLDKLGLSPCSRANKILSNGNTDNSIDENGSVSKFSHLSLGFEYPFLLSELSHPLRRSLIRSVDVNPEFLQIREKGAKDYLRTLVDYFKNDLAIPSAIKDEILKTNNKGIMSNISAHLSGVYGSGANLLTRGTTVVGQALFNTIVPLRTGVSRNIDDDFKNDRCSLRDYQYYVSSFKMLFPIPSLFWMQIREAGMVYNLRQTVRDLMVQTFQQIEYGDDDSPIKKELKKIRRDKNLSSFDKKVANLIFNPIEEGEEASTHSTDTKAKIVMIVNKANLAGIVNLWNKTAKFERFNMSHLDFQARSNKESPLFGDNLVEVVQRLDTDGISGGEDGDLRAATLRNNRAISEFDGQETVIPTRILNLKGLLSKYNEDGTNRDIDRKLKEFTIERVIDELEILYTKLFVSGQLEFDVSKRPLRLIPSIPKHLYGYNLDSYDNPWDNERTNEDIRHSKMESSLTESSNISGQRMGLYGENIDTYKYINEAGENVHVSSDSIANNPNPSIENAPEDIRFKKKWKQRKNIESKEELREIDC